MPQRLLKPAWWREHAEILMGFAMAYILIAVTLVIVLGSVKPQADKGVRSSDRAINSGRETCLKTNESRKELRLLLQGLISASVPSDKAGPGAAYYRDHKDELKEAIQASETGVKQVGAALAARDCDKLYPDH